MRCPDDEALVESPEARKGVDLKQQPLAILPRDDETDLRSGPAGRRPGQRSIERVLLPIVQFDASERRYLKRFIQIRRVVPRNQADARRYQQRFGRADGAEGRQLDSPSTWVRETPAPLEPAEAGA